MPWSWSIPGAPRKVRDVDALREMAGSVAAAAGFAGDGARPGAL